MKILRGAEAPVVAVHFNRRFGFIRPPNDSELYELTHGHHIFFHFDTFEAVHVFRGRMTYRLASMDEAILWLPTVTPDTVLHFDLHVQKNGKFKAAPWTLKPLWDNCLSEFERRKRQTAASCKVAC